MEEKSLSFSLGESISEELVDCFGDIAEIGLDSLLENGLLKEIPFISTAASNNPNFFFMHYSKSDLQIENFIMVPKHFFSTDIIEKRKPLADTAKRAGWVGCNILLSRIPDEGRIFIVQNEKQVPIEQVVSKVKKTDFMKEFKLDARGWILEIMNCVNKIDERTFTLEQIYQFEDMLSIKHPENHHVKDKIRQQLQVLRDNGLIEFLGRGYYRKIL